MNLLLNYLNGGQLQVRQLIKILVHTTVFYYLAFLISGCSSYQMTSAARDIRDRLPEIETQKIFLMKGTVYESPAYIFESNQVGPAVMILGGTHGDEPAGYEAAFRLVDRFIQNPPISKSY